MAMVGADDSSLLTDSQPT